MAHGRGEFESLRPLDEGGPGILAERDASIVGLVGEDGRLDLAPRNVGQVLDTALELVRHRFVMWIGVSTLLWLPVRAMQAALGPHNWASAADGNPLFPGGHDLLDVMARLGVGLSATFIVQSLVTAYVALGVKALVDGSPFRPWGDLGGAFRRIVGLLVIVFLTMVAAGVGMIMCCVPYVYVAWKLVLWPSAYVVEDAGVVHSLRRTIDLTRSSFLRWLGLLVIATLIALPFSSLAAFGDAPDLRSRVLSNLAISDQTLDTWLVPLSSLANAIATALMSATMTVFYFDCRARRDGADLRRELDQLIERAAQDGGRESALGAR